MPEHLREPLFFVIPARGGSKGIPQKNLVPVGGIPLVARAVRTALRALEISPHGGRVICSTDHETIAGVAREWGAEVPFVRPEELATDEAPSIEVVLHAVRACGAEKATVIVIQPTSPLVDPCDVLEALRIHERAGFPVVSVTELEHPTAWTYHLLSEARLESVVEGEIPSRRQAAESCVRLNGAVYVANGSWLLAGKGFLGPDTRGLLMPPERSVDIDTPIDLAAAEGLIAARPEPRSTLGPHTIGPGEPCFVIAEAGVNHDGDLDTALALVDAAADAGADAVKFQTFSAERLVTRTAPKAEYQNRTTDPNETQFDMLERLELSIDDLTAIVGYCRRLGITFLSTPFDEVSADLLEELDVPAFKIGSGDLTNLPFLRHVARKGRPMIVSTGMANLREVALAVDAIGASGLEDLILLQCVSEYPADPATVNLAAMDTMRKAFGKPLGFSDHTEGAEAAMAAVALGAVVVEKHLTLDRERPGPDHRASIEPAEFAHLVRAIRTVEACRGSGRKIPVESESKTARIARKSLVALRTIHEGEVLDSTNLGARRPEGGLPPEYLDEILGRRARCDIAEGAWLQLEMIE